MPIQRVLLIDLNRVEDTEDGCEDNPVYFLVYTLKLVVEHMDARTDASTSTDDFARMVLTMRQRVLNDRKFGGYDQLRCENLLPSPTVYGQDDETLIYGHIGTIEQRVEVRPA
ncbi:MAG: hypothetical protein M3458_05295 [Acidobacteriota bacterium]|nr:hypothetical protein [Acidobacteriota bacterium]